jgi:hypothetical protein
MADIVCTVPECDAQAVLVLNGRPICRPHCEEFAKQASILDGSFRDVLDPADGANTPSLLPGLDAPG